MTIQVTHFRIVRAWLVLMICCISATVQAQQTLHAPNSESGMVGSIQAGDKAVGKLAGLGEDESSSFHTYTIEISPGTKQLVVSMLAEGDLDLAIKHGDVITAYGENPDWDLGDDSTSESATLKIDRPDAGVWYVDVFNSLYEESEIAYELTIK